jgi:hypothetical protein
MEYENQLRESGEYTEMEIQYKFSKLKELSNLGCSCVGKDLAYINAGKGALKYLKELITDENGVPNKDKVGLVRKIEVKIKNIEKEEQKNKHKKTLKLDETQLSNFQCVLKYNEMRDDLISHMGEEQACVFLKTYNIQTVFEIAMIALESKQCNEPFELLLSDMLHLKPIVGKHGFDAVDETTGEHYEHKPSSNTNNPSGTINDDSIDKIEKCENLEKGGYLILGGIDKKTYTFNKIYKFPLEIYNKDRRDYFADLKERNAGKDKQTRSTYSINIKKSIKLCNDFDLDYYVWER